MGLAKILATLDSRADVVAAEDLIEILKAQVSPEELVPWIQFGDTQYARNRIRRTDQYEVLCLCWKPGQKSPTHDHLNSSAAIRVISGNASETAFEAHGDQFEIIGKRSFRPGDVHAEGPELIHQFGNSAESSENLVTLHIYSPPLSSVDVGSVYAGGRAVE